jgi:hypothetical protein
LHEGTNQCTAVLSQVLSEQPITTMCTLKLQPLQDKGGGFLQDVDGWQGDRQRQDVIAKAEGDGWVAPDAVPVHGQLVQIWSLCSWG